MPKPLPSFLNLGIDVCQSQWLCSKIFYDGYCSSEACSMSYADIQLFADGITKNFAAKLHKAVRPDGPAQPALCHSYRRLVKHYDKVARPPAFSWGQKAVAIDQ